MVPLMSGRVCAVGVTLILFAAPLQAQDMLQGVDLAQPAYSQAELSRVDIEKAIAGRPAGAILDFSGKSLNGLDLSQLDLSGANFRAARLNHANLRGARLDGAILDQAWLIEANLSGASLKGVHAFAAQMQRMKADSADFSQARLAGDLGGASLKGAIFDGADLAADMKNQSMGLMRAVLRSTQLQGARFHGANLTSADLRFARAAGADFAGATLINADAAGADFTGAQWRDARTDGLDLDSAHIDADAIEHLSTAQHLDRAQRQ
jgi:uncharacterized protein YjbI with pentapeptide repeats